ncbi:MAG TPA: adenylate/guanylate cyclase domain-containing protein [Capillimicrobium sp.]|nr:adenylate/guanylate cyclase domain-containing protein [Capillimicrobium sp.]
MVPTTQYARNGDVSIAFQTVGQGPPDLLLSIGFVSHLEHLWEEPGLARYLSRIASFCRVILFDRRGIGLSDPGIAPDLEIELGDVDAVLDAAGAEQVVMVGQAGGAPLCLRYAVERPDRVSALILYAALAATQAGPGYEFTYTADERARTFEEILAHWGEGQIVHRAAPSAADDPRLRAWFARLERLSASPGAARASIERGAADVRELLPRITQPTLLLHRIDDELIDVRHSRYMAEHIPNARLVELPGRDNLPSIGDAGRLVSEISEFVTGRPLPVASDRALRTVLFTDVCDATRRAAELGDARWRDTLAAHDAAATRAVERYGGRLIKTTGDGILATFAGAPSDAVRCADALVDELAGLGVTARAGLHTGECELIGDDVGGMAVHIAARVCDLAEPRQVLVSGTVFGTVVGSELRFDDLGSHELKGVAFRWPLFALAA